MVYLVARSSGMLWWIDDTPSMLYRQHGRNEVGANVGPRAILDRVRRLARGEYRVRVRRAMEIAMRCGGRIGSATHLSPLQIFLHGRRRWRDALIAALTMPRGVSATMHAPANRGKVGAT
jgi:rhamnosyltransferase